jgi:hypothetical protein
MGNAESTSVGNVHWHPGSAGPCCIVMRISHVPGMPCGAAELLARWVQHGTVAYPHRSALRRALEAAGAELQYKVRLHDTTFSLVAASWDWGRDFMVELLRRPLLETEHFEELDMQRAEAGKRKPLAPWVAQQWGWVGAAPCKTATQMRGVWAHVYAPPHMAIAVAGGIPATSQQLLQQLGAPLQLTRQADAWSPPPPTAASPLSMQTMRGPPGVTLLFAFPPLAPQQCNLIQYLWGQYLQSECDQCRGWAQSAALQWHVLGSAAVLDVTLTVPAGIHRTGEQLSQEATRKLQQYRPSAATLHAAVKTLEARDTVVQSTLVRRTAAFLEPPRPDAQAVLELCRAHLAAPQTTILRSLK